MRFYTPILVALFSIASFTTATPSGTDTGSTQQDINTFSSPTAIEARARPAEHGNFGKPGRLCHGEVATGTDKLGFACVMAKSKKTGKLSCQKPRCITGAFKVLVEKAKAKVGSRTETLNKPQSKPQRSRRYNALQRRDMCDDAQCDEDADCEFYGAHCNVCLGHCTSM